MNMKKKIVTLGLVAALLLTSAGATLAYFTDTESAQNVMTMGKVDIEQKEQQRNDTGVLVDFVNNKPLMPMVDNRADKDTEPVVNGWFDPEMKNVVDKVISVKNNADPNNINAKNMSAYVRTLFAFEGRCDVQAIYIGRLQNTTDWEFNYLPKAGETETVTSEGLVNAREVMINNVVHTIVEAIYTANDGILEAGETTSPSLKQIFMAPTADNEAYDTWFGSDYTIYAVTQAVQTAGFTDPETALDTAFGDPALVDDQTMFDWFKNVE